MVFLGEKDIWENICTNCATQWTLCDTDTHTQTKAGQTEIQKSKTQGHRIWPMGDGWRETSGICHRIEERLVYEITCLVTVWISSLILKTPIFVRATIKQNQKIMHTHSEWAQKSNFTSKRTHARAHAHAYNNNRSTKIKYIYVEQWNTMPNERANQRINEWMIKSLSRLLISDICWASVFDCRSFECKYKYKAKGQNWISINCIHKKSNEKLSVCTTSHWFQTFGVKTFLHFVLKQFLLCSFNTMASNAIDSPSALQSQFVQIKMRQKLINKCDCNCVGLPWCLISITCTRF